MRLLNNKKHKKNNMMLGLAFAGSSLLLMSQTSMAQQTECNRECLIDISRQVLVSMKQKDSSHLPLARWYAFTENGAPSAPGMSSLWRTVTDFKNPGMGQFVVDPKTGQVFVVAEVLEGPSSAVFFGRLKVENKQLTELELYISRSKGESGQVFDPKGLEHLPVAWTTPVPDALKVSRDELTRLGGSVFNKKLGSPEGSKSCELVEMGGRVVEDPEALKAIMPKDDLSHRQIVGGVSVPCTAPDRPEDLQARLIVDEEQGVSVSLGVVPGVVFGSFITPGLESTFVPKAMAAGFERLPQKMRDPNTAKSGSTGVAYVPVIRTFPASMAVAEMTKFHGKTIEGVQRYLHIQPIGSGSPWVKDEATSQR
jgi:hypothetical protein